MNKIKKRNTKANHIKNNAICEIKEKIRDELEKLTDKNYTDKIIRDEKTQMVTCIFENKNQMDAYKKGHRINFRYKNNKGPDLTTKEGIEEENKKISSVINLRERLHDLNLSEEHRNKLDVFNAKIKIIESKNIKNGEPRDGTAVHISKHHSEIGNSAEAIAKINESFVNPDNLRIYVDNEDSNRYFFVTRYDKKHVLYALLDKRGENIFEFFDVYYLRNKSFKQKLKNMNEI